MISDCSDVNVINQSRQIELWQRMDYIKAGLVEYRVVSGTKQVIVVNQQVH